jgi:hypothetical protein
MVMSFCKKSVHAFLSLTTSIDTTTATTTAITDKLHHHHHHISSSFSGGLGLITANGGDMQRSPNVLESSSVKSTLPPAPMKDPRGIGFIDDIGGGVDGLMSCTESLGFESSDERRFDDKIEEEMKGNESNDVFQRRTTTTRMKWKKEGGEVKKFPPPLSSMTRNGQRNFFLRAVRKDGRLELTEVRVDRTEILRASREDGRLRLHLIRDDDIQDCTDDEEEEEEEEEEVVEEEEEAVVEEEEAVVEVVEEVKEKKEKENGIEEDTVEEKGEEGIGEWMFPATGEGFIRCHELVSHHQHHNHHQHNLHIWRQHCVTTG